MLRNVLIHVALLGLSLSKNLYLTDIFTWGSSFVWVAHLVWITLILLVTGAGRDIRRGGEGILRWNIFNFMKYQIQRINYICGCGVQQVGGEDKAVKEKVDFKRKSKSEWDQKF